MEGRGAALHVEPAGQDAADRHAAIDAGGHRPAIASSRRSISVVGKLGALVGAGDVGDGQLLALGDGEQLLRLS